MRAVFLDRDDTLIDNAAATAATPTPGDLFDPGLVRLLPGVRDACTALADAGFALIVVTNQAAVAEGLCSPAQVEATNDRLRDLLARPDGTPLLTALYYSPCIKAGSVPRFTCDHDWRKPAPGMIRAAAHELDIDPAGSWLVGDGQRDVQAGIAAGIPKDHCLLIAPDSPLPDLRAASRRILPT